MNLNLDYFERFRLMWAEERKRYCSPTCLKVKLLENPNYSSKLKGNEKKENQFGCSK